MTETWPEGDNGHEGPKGRNWPLVRSLLSDIVTTKQILALLFDEAHLLRLDVFRPAPYRSPSPLGQTSRANMTSLKN